MAVNVEVVAEKVFNLLAGNGYDISNLNSKGEKVIDPQDATRFVVVNPNILVRLDKATETLSMGVRETFDDDGLREAFKSLAGDYLMNFDYRIFGKQLQPKSETIDIAQKTEKNMGDVLEAINELRTMAGLESLEEYSVAPSVKVTNDFINWCEEKGMDWPKMRFDFNSNPDSLKGLLARYKKETGEAGIVESDDLELDEKSKGLYYNVNKRKKAGTSRSKDHPKAPSKKDWENAAKTAKESVEELDEYRQFDRYTLERGYNLLNDEFKTMKARKGEAGVREYYRREGQRYLARQLYKRGIVGDYSEGDDLVSIYVRQRQKMQINSIENLDEPLQELDRVSLDQDLPPNYFDHFRRVKKYIMRKYGSDDRVQMIISRLNDEEKAKGQDADPQNILMKVSAHLGESAQWEKIDEGFSGMSGSTKTSYQGLDNVKLVIRHKKEVNEEIRGSRSRNISSIFVQRGDERFKMAENNLKAARAMARHVKNGGEPFDTVGSAINEMAVEQRKLREFIRYVKKSGLVNEDNESYVNLAVENINYIASAFTRLAGVKSYATAVEDVTDRRNTEVLQDDIDLESKFTETHFDDRVANVVDFVKSAMSRKTAYESYIDKAVSNESFAKLKNMLSEDDGMEFATPHAKLGYQVSQMSNSVNDPRLGNYLTGISKKLYSGDRMSQHEYTTIKSCLLGAHNNQSVSTSVAESVEDQYEKFIEQFDIL